MSARSHEEYQDNIGAYLLGALPELEVELLERHMATCESCRAEVAQLEPVTSAIARSVPQVEPPPSLKASLMATVREEAAQRAAAERPARRRSLPAWFAGLQPRMAAGLALAVLAIGVVIGVAAGQIGSGNGKTLSARVDRTVIPSGSASLRVSSDDTKATFRLSAAPAPPSGRVYKLWIQRGKTIQPGPVVTHGGDASIRIPGGVRGASAVMVTVESNPNATAPTGKPIMRVDV